MRAFCNTHWQLFSYGKVCIDKNFCHAQRILAVKEVGVGGLSESVKKGKFVTKIFFSDNVEWSSKILWKMISADVQANKNTKKEKI